MELLITLGLTFIIIVVYQVYQYNIRKKQKKSLPIDYRRLEELMGKGNFNEALQVIEVLLKNPHLNLKQLDSIKSYIERMDKFDFKRNEVDRIKDTYRKKKAYYNRRIVYEGGYEEYTIFTENIEE